MIDRLFPGVGRVRRASGTTDRRVFRELGVMLTTFSLQARYDLLEAIRDGAIKPTFALTWFKRAAIDKIPTADVLPPLGETFDTWRLGLDCSHQHRKSLGTTRRHLAIAEHHILQDAPGLLAAYRLRATAHPASCNKARAHVMAFLRDQVGQSHRLWSAVSDQRPAKQPKRAPRAQLAVEDVRRLVVQLGPVHGIPAWGMAATGMGPKEFWGAWEERPDRVHIEGSKRAGRVRDVPRWTRVEKPPRSFMQFRRALKASGAKVQPYDFRRAYARWLEEAGVMLVNQAAYMGHGPRGMTQLYKLGELPGQLMGDAAKLKAYASEPDLIPVLTVAVSA